MPKLPQNKRLIYAGAGIAVLIALYTIIKGSGTSQAASPQTSGQTPTGQALAAGWIPPGTSTLADNSAALSQFGQQVGAQTNTVDQFSQNLSQLSSFLSTQPQPSPTPSADGANQTITALLLQHEADLVAAVAGAARSGGSDPAAGKYQVNQVYGRNGKSGGYTYLGNWSWRGAQGRVKASVGHPPQAAR